MAQLYWPFDTAVVTEWPGGVSDIRYGVHMGTDFGVPQGTELRATSTGTISATYKSDVDGWGIDIRTPDGMIIRNWHLSDIQVTHGQGVEAGQIIGLTGGAVGTPGAGLSTGSHLHWELRKNTNFSQDGWIDPRSLDVKSFSELPIPPQEVDPMAKLYQNKVTSEVAAIGIDSGYIYTVPTFDYLKLIQGWHIFENDEPIPLDDNIFNYVKDLAKLAPAYKAANHA